LKIFYVEFYISCAVKEKITFVSKNMPMKKGVIGLNS